MEQIPLKAYYDENGKLDGLSELQQGDLISSDFIAVLPKEKLGIRLDAWLTGVNVTGMEYDTDGNLIWALYETGHRANIFYDANNDDLMYKVDYYLNEGLINTLELSYDTYGNLLNANWIEH